MDQSDRHFSKSLEQINHRLDGGSYRCYVSLGVGTGSKDYQILNSKLIDKKGYYFPVDMSPEMLQVGIQAAYEGAPGPDRHQILPVQIDFSRDENVSALQKLFEHFSEDGEPVLFSLLGNTLANFDPDTALLKTLSTLIRPQDRILTWRMATTRQPLRQGGGGGGRGVPQQQAVQAVRVAARAAPEHRPAVGLKNLEFQPAIEGDRVHPDQGHLPEPGRGDVVTLPNYEMVDFPQEGHDPPLPDPQVRGREARRPGRGVRAGHP